METYIYLLLTDVTDDVDVGLAQLALVDAHLHPQPLALHRRLLNRLHLEGRGLFRGLHF